MKRTIPLDKLIDDQTLQIRKLDEAVVQEYRELDAYRDPIMVRAFASKGQYQIVDGFHRTEAARRRGWTEIEAIIVEGKCESDFLRAAVRANTSHGKPMTNREKQKACKDLFMWLHREGKALPPSTEIAKVCGISSAAVGGYRDELVEQGLIEAPKVTIDSLGRKRAARNRSTMRKPVLLKFADAALKFMDELPAINDAAWEQLSREDRREVFKELTEFCGEVKRVLAVRPDEPSLQPAADEGASSEEHELATES